jgi:hypothetical protein
MTLASYACPPRTPRPAHTFYWRSEAGVLETGVRWGIPSAVRPLPKLPLPLRPAHVPYLLVRVYQYVFGQNVTEHNPAPSPSGHPLLSGPPTLNVT